MPKVKVPRKSTAIDMTAMCDVAFLLLTFFMLTTKFKPPEQVVIDLPSSRSELKLPERDLAMINVDKDGKVYFSIDNANVRARMFERMRVLFPNVQFTPEQVQKFAVQETFGVPFAQLPEFLNLTTEQQIKVVSPGIPTDSLPSSGGYNELAEWIQNARKADAELTAAGEKTGDGMRIAIKGDGASEYPKVKGVIKTLTDLKINKFNLITTMEGGAVGARD